MPVPRIVSSLHNFHKGELFHLRDSTHAKLCFPVQQKKKNPFHCCDSNERHCRNVAPIWSRGGQSSHHDAARASHNLLLETNISPWWLETAGSARHTASWHRVVLNKSTDKFKCKPSKRLISAAGNQWRRHSKQVTVSSSGFDKSGEAHCCGNRFADEEVVFETCWTSDSRGNWAARTQEGKTERKKERSVAKLEKGTKLCLCEV